MINRQQLLDFMNNHPLMVISSNGPDGQPQSAVVGFGQTEDLQIIFGTASYNRKAHNIAKDSRVSVVIGWDKDGTLQYEGRARLLEGAEADRYADMYFTKTPAARKYNDDPEEVYFLIDPTWLRFTDVTKNPWDVQELRF